MFDMTTAQARPADKGKGAKNQPVTPVLNSNGIYVNENGVTKDAWFKEEEMMRKKLEKTAITQLKNRIAAANRQAGNKNAQETQQVDGNDSDMEPPDNKDSDLNNGQNAVNAA